MSFTQKSPIGAVSALLVAASLISACSGDNYNADPAPGVTATPGVTSSPGPNVTPTPSPSPGAQGDGFTPVTFFGPKVLDLSDGEDVDVPVGFDEDGNEVSGTMTFGPGIKLYDADGNLLDASKANVLIKLYNSPKSQAPSSKRIFEGDAQAREEWETNAGGLTFTDRNLVDALNGLFGTSLPREEPITLDLAGYARLSILVDGVAVHRFDGKITLELVLVSELEAGKQVAIITVAGNGSDDEPQRAYIGSATATAGDAVEFDLDLLNEFFLKLVVSDQLPEGDFTTGFFIGVIKSASGGGTGGPTPSASPTASPGVTPGPTVSPTPGPTVIPTPGPTPTVIPTPTPTNPPACDITGSGSGSGAGGSCSCTDSNGDIVTGTGSGSSGGGGCFILPAS